MCATHLVGLAVIVFVSDALRPHVTDVMVTLALPTPPRTTRVVKCACMRVCLCIFLSVSDGGGDRSGSFTPSF